MTSRSHTTQDSFQTLTPISSQVAQIVTIAIRGPKSLELQLARHHAALGRAETRRGQRERRAAHTRLSCSGYASTCRGQFDTATRRADGSPASYGDMTLKSVPSRCASRTSSTSTISRTCLGKRSLLGTVPMAESAGEPAILHRLDELPLVRAPRGAQPQDGVWRMRGGLWINRHGMALYEEDAGESDSADDDELGSARPAASHTFTSHPLCNHRFCVRRWLQRLQCHAFGPRPLYLTRLRFTPVTSPAPRTPAPPYVSSRSEQAAVCAQMPPRAGAPASVKRSRASMFPRLARSDEWRESRMERGRGRGLVGEQSVGV